MAGQKIGVTVNGSEILSWYQQDNITRTVQAGLFSITVSSKASHSWEILDVEQLTRERDAYKDERDLFLRWYRETYEPWVQKINPFLEQLARQASASPSNPPSIRVSKSGQRRIRLID